MALTDIIDQIDGLIVSGANRATIKPVLDMLRDQAAALETRLERMALNAQDNVSHSDYQDLLVKSEANKKEADSLRKEIEQLKKEKAAANAQYGRPDFTDLGTSMQIDPRD